MKINQFQGKEAAVASPPLWQESPLELLYPRGAALLLAESKLMHPHEQGVIGTRGVDDQL